jgi:hypothetical protein
MALVKDQTQRTFESDLWLKVVLVLLHIRLRAVWLLVILITGLVSPKGKEHA